MKTDLLTMGAIDQDIYLNVIKYPHYGQNVRVQKVEKDVGGKGSNQAVTVAKQGLNCVLIGALGKDNAATQILSELKSYKVGVDYIVKKADKPTGSAYAVVDKTGENTFLVDLGANNILNKADVDTVFKNVETKTILMNLETDKEASLQALKNAQQRKMKVILDPAPATSIFKEAVSYADIVTPNIEEAETLSDMSIKTVGDYRRAAVKISDLGVENVIITLGKNGSLLYEKSKDKFTKINSYKVKAVNTVGAGDTYDGVLAARLVKGDNLPSAIKYATAASALKVTRNGGHKAIPTNPEIEKFIKNNPKVRIS